jgi:adenylate cyclase
MSATHSRLAQLILRSGLVTERQLATLSPETSVSQRLGDELVARGMLSRTQLQGILSTAISRGEFDMLDRPPLGEVLLGLRFIEPQALDATIALQQATGQRLGQILMEQSICTPEQVYEALGIQSRLSAQVKEEARGAGHTGARRRLLLVDDSPFSCALVKEALSLRGFEVSTCTDPLLALEQVETERPSLILTDLDMPELDGNALCQRIKNESKHPAPVIILTANDRDKERVVGLRSGADDYVHKGVSMNELAARIDSVLRRTDETERMRSIFARYTSDGVVEEVLRSGQLVLGGQKREVTVLFADVRNFTAIAESEPAEVVIRLLNDVLGRLADVVVESHGTLDKFLGDGLMAVWGAPMHHDASAEAAVAAAMRMVDTVRQVEFERPVELGIGINTGIVIAGGVGSARRTEYTCIGDAVNVAARLCAMAGPQEILLGEATRNQLQTDYPVERLSPVRVKGRLNPVSLFSLSKSQGRGAA